MTMQEMILHVAVPATRLLDPKDRKAVLMFNRIFSSTFYSCMNIFTRLTNRT